MSARYEALRSVVENVVEDMTQILDKGEPPARVDVALWRNRLKNTLPPRTGGTK